MTAFLILLAAHWIADFVLQTDWQAKNKSSNNVALTRHVLIYTAVLGAVAVPIFGPGPLWFGFVWANGALHFMTDYVTSRINSRLWAKGDSHNFFVSVGFDQLLHQVTLALTMKVFFGWT